MRITLLLIIFCSPLDFPGTVTLMPVRDWSHERDYEVQKVPLTDEQYLARNREHYIPEEAVTVQYRRDPRHTAIAFQPTLPQSFHIYLNTAPKPGTCAPCRAS